MDIKREIKVELTIDEISKILIEYLNKKGVSVSHVRFDVRAHYDETDWRSEFPPSYELDKAICTGTEDLN